MLELGLQRARAAAAAARPELVAAATPKPKETLYEQVMRVVGHKQEVFEIALDDGPPINIFEIMPEQRLVKPIHHEGVKFTIKSTAHGTQTVTPYVGIYIPWNELEGMRIDIRAVGSEGHSGSSEHEIFLSEA